MFRYLVYSRSRQPTAHHLKSFGSRKVQLGKQSLPPICGAPERTWQNCLPRLVAWIGKTLNVYLGGFLRCHFLRFSAFATRIWGINCKSLYWIVFKSLYQTEIFLHEPETDLGYNPKLPVGRHKSFLVLPPGGPRTQGGGGVRGWHWGRILSPIPSLVGLTWPMWICVSYFPCADLSKPMGWLGLYPV